MSEAMTAERVRARLEAVEVPGGGTLAASGRLSEIVVQGGKVFFSITVAAEEAAAWEPVRARAADLVRKLPGCAGVVVTLTAARAAGPAPARPQGGPARARAQAGNAIPNVRAIVAVASGKGGVGKSTTAVNIALGLKAEGLNVALLDADIYGPSVPRLLGLSGKPELVGERTIAPLSKFGIEVMSIGFMVGEETPMVWRGPMVMSAITQMLREVRWGQTDVMVVDMPPGTGDAQLTMAQQVPLAGAVIVSTPQDLALIDARRGVAMFRKVEVPVLGVVENMATFCCPNCGHVTSIFGHGGARAEAEKLGVPFLGEVPLDPLIRERSDAGLPLVVSEPESAPARIYRDIAARLRAEIGRGVAAARPAPRIVFES